MPLMRTQMVLPRSRQSYSCRPLMTWSRARYLVGGRDGVLEIEEDVVRLALERLGEHGRIGPGHRQLAALQAGPGRLVTRVAHAPTRARVARVSAGLARVGTGGRLLGGEGRGRAAPVLLGRSDDRFPASP
mgnify:CR=1 FL=1